MANTCNVFLSVSGPSEVLKQFCFSTVSFRTGSDSQTKNLYFTLDALVPCSSDESPYDCWGCRCDVFDDITLQKMGWQEGCETISIFFQTLNAPPIYWFYKVVSLYPQLEFGIFANSYLSGFEMTAHASGGEVTDEQVAEVRLERTVVCEEDPEFPDLEFAMPDEAYFEELDIQDAQGLWDFDCETESSAEDSHNTPFDTDENTAYSTTNDEDETDDAADLRFFLGETYSFHGRPALDWRSFADKPAGVVLLRNGTPLVLKQYREALGLNPLSREELSKLKFGDSIDPLIFLEKKDNLIEAFLND